MGTVLGSNAVRTAHLWSKHASEALARAGAADEEREGARTDSPLRDEALRRS
jgi:hypothetical protein